MIKESKAKFIKMLEKGDNSSIIKSLKTIMQNYKNPKQVKEFYAGANQLSDLVATKEYGLVARKTPKLYAPGTIRKNEFNKNIDLSELNNDAIIRAHKENATSAAKAAKIEPDAFAAVYKKSDPLDRVSITYNEYMREGHPDKVPIHIQKAIRSVSSETGVKPYDIGPDNIVGGKVVDVEFIKTRHDTGIVPHPTKELLKGLGRQERRDLMKHIIYTKRNAYG